MKGLIRVKKLTFLLASILCSWLAFGCSSPSTNASSTSSASSKNSSVATTCSLSSNGLSLTFELTAPARDQDVKEMIIKMIVPFEVGRELVGVDSSQASDEEMKKALEEMEGTYKSLFSSRFGIPEEDMDLSVLDDAAVFTAVVDDVKDFKEKANLQTEELDSITFNNLVKTLKNNDFVCE